MSRVGSGWLGWLGLWDGSENRSELLRCKCVCGKFWQLGALQHNTTQRNTTQTNTHIHATPAAPISSTASTLDLASGTGTQELCNTFLSARAGP